MYDVISVSKYIILYCKKHNLSITNLKLQKLLYFVQAEFVVNHDRPAFDDDIIAWDFGPVVIKAFDYFKIWGSSEIPDTIVTASAIQTISRKDQKSIDALLDECANCSVVYLTRLVHKQSPWKTAFYHSPDHIITKESLVKFFSD